MFDDAGRRSARAFDPADAYRLRRSPELGSGRLDGIVEQSVEDREGLPELERALFESGLDVACGALGDERLEASVGEPWRRGADVVGEAGLRVQPGRPLPGGARRQR